MLGVVAHDAGGAEILSSYVRRERLSCAFAVEGPARIVFERKLGRISTEGVASVVARSASLLCGTSWQSDLERRAIKLARAAGKRSIAFLDHWICYRERFKHASEICLPDEIWVADEIAESLARSAFPGMPISQVGNPYFDDVRRELAERGMAAPSLDSGLVVLYVCEPLKEQALAQYGNARYWGYVEEDALEYFLKNIRAVGRAIGEVIIRPHPAEPRDKYDWVRDRFDLPFAIETPGALLDDIARSHVVVGCESMAMVIALLAGRRVISSVPPGGKPCSLPHPAIESLQALLSTRVFN